MKSNLLLDMQEKENKKNSAPSLLIGFGNKPLLELVFIFQQPLLDI